MLALASVTHLLWFLRHLLKSLPIVVGFQLEFLLIGIAVSSWLKPWIPPRPCLPEIGLVGLAFAIFYSQIWSLFGGLHPGSNGILVLITLVSLLSRYRTTISFLREAWNYTNVALLIALLPVLLVAAWNALTSSLTCYDIQGYHLQAVRWAAEFGSVPGLANLHGRLGFNSALDPLAALLSSPGGLWLGREYVNGAIVIITLAVLLQGTAGSGTRTIYALLLLPFPVSLLFSNCLSSPQPDVAADSSAVLFAWYLRDTVLGNESEASSALFPVFLTGALALVFKISNAAFAATGVCLALVCWSRSRRAIRQLMLAIFSGGTLCIPWIARGYLTSGYPFFPAEIGRFEFDWTVPKQLIASERDQVLSWARWPYNLNPDEVLSSWSWFGPWVRQLPSYPIVVKASALALIGLIVSAWALRASFSRPGAARWAVFCLPSFLSFLFWFSSAPSPRFAQGVIWVLAVNLFYLAIVASTQSNRSVAKLSALVCTLFLCLEIVPGLVRLAAEPIQFPNYNGGAPPMALMRTYSGADIWVPKNGAGAVDWKLPTTPPDRFNPRLEQRGPTLRDGFRIRE